MYLEMCRNAWFELLYLCVLNVFFRTVWYELLCNDWPFRSQPCETIIWQVGRGIKQSLSSVSAPREVKVSWSSLDSQLLYEVNIEDSTKPFHQLALPCGILLPGGPYLTDILCSLLYTNHAVKAQSLHTSLFVTAKSKSKIQDNKHNSELQRTAPEARKRHLVPGVVYSSSPHLRLFKECHVYVFEQPSA